MRVNDCLQSVAISGLIRYPNVTSPVAIHVVSQVTGVPGVFLERVDSVTIPLRRKKSKVTYAGSDINYHGLGATKAIRIHEESSCYRFEYVISGSQ